LSLQERLYEDMKEAMKAREAGKRKLSTIRLARAAIKYREIELGYDLTDEDVLAVLAREVKQRRESIVEFKHVDRPDAVKNLEDEIAVLEVYLPQQLSVDEIMETARQVVVSTGASSMRDLGHVMGVLMPLMKGRADGKMVQEVVRSLLTGAAAK
jgi:uncharacterized protein YqeY